MWHPKLPWSKKNAKRAPLNELAPSLGIQSALGKLQLYATPADPPPGGDSSYRKMQHDPQVKACLSTKKFAVLSRGWEVHPATSSDADKHVAEFCRWCLENMAGSVLDAGYDILDALALGISVVEINYRLIGSGPWHGFVGLASLKAKDPRHFIMRTDEFYNIEALRVATGDDLDPTKFLIYSYQPQYGNPYGISDLRAAYRSWYMKDAILTYWAKFLEKMGIPTVTGEYASAKGYTDAQKLVFLNLVSQVQNEAALVFPDDLKVGLLEPRSAASTGATFDELVSYCDRAMAKAILGQSLTSDSSARGSTYALGAVQENVLRFYLNKLGQDLEEAVMTRQLLARLVAFNFAPGTAVPAFRLGKIDDDRLAVAGKLIADLITGGVVAPGEAWIRDYLGLPAAVEQTV